ncbi:vWA domain-containing protein [Parasulfitobacter algicola]|uniref:TROVE domain-containing protein n=1 Tax=Parasulfitobacter algicola TaxID=2614809 RepID=A0ABX2ILL6_9RHOB|nr:TROVE domain-containing protein [Sulfitobacter algicola]NSX53749.1 TROVE domain-containing protein [Sulfitobacter algicola]
MANKSVFASIKGRLLPATNTRNVAGAPAYRYSDAHALAQVAMTGTFGATYYQNPLDELSRTLELANKVDPSFLAQTAVYTRKSGHMKDMPALLLAVLAGRDPVLFRHAFGRVVDNGKMLRTFVQIMRSGQTGRKSLGSAPKRMVANWLNDASDRAILQANVGNDPSLADVIKMVHPKPSSKAREALFAWIIGRPCDVALLPVTVQDFLRFKEIGKGEIPDVPFQMLTQLPLSTKHWAKIAENASWQMTRMNLNTFQRHGVLALPKMRAHIAATLRDPEKIAKARVFPYQLMTAYQALSADMPAEIRDALHDAMELSVRNVPKLHGQVVVCPDVSGSMSGAVTGYRKGATTVMRFVDVAGLVSAAILRQNPSATVLPFEMKVRGLRLEPRDTILTNAARLAEQWGGGTNCAAPLEWLLAKGRAPDLVIMVSDNQSWAHCQYGNAGTVMMKAWEKLKSRNSKAKLVCIDIAPYGTTQAKEREDVLNIGGFSDTVFDQIAAFATGKMGPDHWVGQIKAVEV